MTQHNAHDWQNLEPPLDQIDQQLQQALRGPQPPDALAERIFEATADDVMDAQLTAILRDAAPAAAPADLAARIAAATQPATATDAAAPTALNAARPRSVLATIGRFAAAAIVTLAVGVTVHLSTNTAPDSAAPGSASPAVATLETDSLDAIEWTLAAEDDIHREVSALADELATLNELADADSDAAIEEELTRQLYYYELADAQAASF